ncbi:MAG: putative lipid II flippase FtsW [Vicinamibacterales bacterium]
MARKLKSDMVLFIATVLLVFLGVLMVYSASEVLARQRYGDSYLFLRKQVMWAALGLGSLALVMRVDYRTYRQPVFIWTSLGIVATALVLVLFSAPINNARRWFSVGGLGIQPSELAKLSAIFFVAWFLDKRIHRINELHYAIVPIAVVLLPLVVLVLLEPDFGTAMTIALIAGAMIFAAGLDFRYFGATLLLAAPAVAFLIVSSPYRFRRLMTFWDPWADPRRDGFQIIQSLVAVGTGGWAGKGLTQGVQKLFYLPEPHTDFIYAVIGEELGLIGTVLTLVCFCVIAWRGLQIATGAPDAFGSLVAMGLTTMIAMQALVNISVVLSMMPTKGIPLPLVSSGGSSLLINLVGMGVLLNISPHASTEG